MSRKEKRKAEGSRIKFRSRGIQEE